MMDEWKSARVAREHSGWDANKSKIHLACLSGMTEVLGAYSDL